MAKRVIILIGLNVAIFALIAFWFAARESVGAKSEELASLKSIDKIIVRVLESGDEFLLQKSAKFGKWEVVFGEHVLPANIFGVEYFYKKLTEICAARSSTTKNLSFGYEVRVFSKGISKSFRIDAEEARVAFPRGYAARTDGEGSREASAIDFLSSKVFSRVGSDCQIFKIKFNDGEFIFAKRHGKWFLDNPKSNLEIGDELIVKFFHRALLLEGAVAPNLDYWDETQPDFSITLYGKNSSERVDFFGEDAEMPCTLAVSDMLDLVFSIDREDFAGVRTATRGLLKFQIFSLPQCEDINIALAASGEQFNFHDLKSQNKWQITYSKNGEVRVEEISAERIDEMLQVLRRVESTSVLSELPIEVKSFTVAFDEGAKHSQTFNFYEDDGRVFVEPSGQDVKFEIDASFVPAFFDLLRAVFEKVGSVAL